MPGAGKAFAGRRPTKIEFTVQRLFSAGRGLARKTEMISYHVMSLTSHGARQQ